MTRATLAAAAAFFVLGPAAAAYGGTSAPVVIGAVEAQTSVTGYGRWVSWSAFDPRVKRFRLVLWERGRGTRMLPVPSRAVVFDADIGPDARNRPTLVYSRCSGEGTTASRFTVITTPGEDCDVYAFDITAGRERRVTGVSSRVGSETYPSIWRRRIVFQRRISYAASAEGADRVQLRVLRSGRQRSEIITDAAFPGDAEPRLAALQLYGDRLVYKATLDISGCPANPVPSSTTSRDVSYLVDLRRHTRTIIENVCNGRNLTAPTLGPFGVTSITLGDPILALSRISLSPLRRTQVVGFNACVGDSTAQYDFGLIAVVRTDPSCVTSTYGITTYPARIPDDG